MNTGIKYRIGKSTAFKGIVIILSAACVFPLLAILFYVLRQGVSHINFHFLVNVPKPVGEPGGGIANALLGSLMIVLVAAIIAIPIGILSGIYLSENKSTRLAYWSRLSVDILQGVPSIVIGIVIYFWVVKPMRSFSAFSGSVALAIMMLAHCCPVYRRNIETIT